MNYNCIPEIEDGFDFEKALSEFGFCDFLEKDSGVTVAFGYIDELGRDITVEFCNSFITNFQSDCLITSDKDGKESVLYMGVSPVNQRDFDFLMQYIIPSKKFVDSLYSRYIS